MEILSALLATCFGVSSGSGPRSRRRRAPSSVHDGLLTSSSDGLTTGHYMQAPPPTFTQHTSTAQSDRPTWSQRLTLQTLDPRHACRPVRERWDDDFTWSEPGGLELPPTLDLQQSSVKRDLGRVRQIRELVDWLKSLQPAVDQCLAGDAPANASLPRRSLRDQLETNWVQARFLIDLVDETRQDALAQVRRRPRLTASADSGYPSPDPRSTRAGKAPAIDREADEGIPDPFSDDEFVAEDDVSPHTARDPALKVAEQITLLHRLMAYRQHRDDATTMPPVLLTVDDLQLLTTECQALVTSVEATLAEFHLVE
ncbi:hypothetical protein IWQ60_009856 [Tieghemiomyces parasiticus]|uniref:Uncharacterized protein n=1 Tax=Tieghemiomyces parasiticus TaxID=78921 RepID=A0A9W7ZSB1_9FUNG|nr:hypothetical protein IWQ60_009856 [Tieghemiomyces parasiticus]